MMSLGEKYSVDSFTFFVGSEFFKLKELGKEMRERERKWEQRNWRKSLSCRGKFSWKGSREMEL